MQVAAFMKNLSLTALAMFISAWGQFSIDSSTVALWRFDQKSGLLVPDAGANNLNLTMSRTLPLIASPFDSALSLDGSGAYLSRAYNSRFSIGRTGYLTYEARIRLEAYPDGRASQVMGIYEGLKMIITPDGRLQAVAQLGDGTTWDWYSTSSLAGTVPLNRWVNLAIAADQDSSRCYAYIDGQPMQLYTYLAGAAYQPLPNYSGTQFRSAASTFAVGNSVASGRIIDTLPFKGEIEELRVSDALVLGQGPAPITTIQRHFPLDSVNTVALWTFDSRDGNTIPDAGPNGFNLTQSGSPLLEASPFGSAMAFTATGQYLSTGNNNRLNVAATGRITFEARVFMTAYPPVNNFNGQSSLLGMYEGLKLQILQGGRLQAAGQKLNASGVGYWYAPTSDPGVIPLNRWVDVAVAQDQASGQAYGYVDGVPVQLYERVNMDPFRISTSVFTVGVDARDGQQFYGKIDEIRVSNSLVLGLGLQTLPTSINGPTAFSSNSVKISRAGPASWKFTAPDGAGPSYTVSFFAADGKKAYTGHVKGGDLVIPGNRLPSGLCLYRLSSENGIWTGRLHFQ